MNPFAPPIGMQSLRSRKPSESQAKAQPPRQNTMRKPNPAARDAERRATRVGEKMKKRMSMRYADISLPANIVGVPDVPSLPAGLRSAPLHEDGALVEEPGSFVEEPNDEMKEEELKLLDKDDFDPDACASSCRCIASVCAWEAGGLMLAGGGQTSS